MNWTYTPRNTHTLTDLLKWRMKMCLIWIKFTILINNSKTWTKRYIHNTNWKKNTINETEKIKCVESIFLDENHIASAYSYICLNCDSKRFNLNWMIGETKSQWIHTYNKSPCFWLAPIEENWLENQSHWRTRTKCLMSVIHIKWK